MQTLLNRLNLRTLVLISLAILLVVEGAGKIYDARKLRSRKAKAAQAGSAQSGLVVYGGIEYSVAKPEDVYRILLFGGSAAEGFGLSRESAWRSFLERRLDEALTQKGLKIEIVNMAKGGNTSFDNYIKLLREGLPMSPDLVIFYTGWNDMDAFMRNPGWTIRNGQKNLLKMEKGIGRFDLWMNLKRNVFLIRKFDQVKEDFQESVSLFYARLNAFREGLFFSLQKGGSLPLDELAGQFGFNEWKRVGAEDLSFDRILSERKVDASYFEYYPKYRGTFLKLYETHYRRNLRSIAAALHENKITSVFVFQPDLLFEASRRQLNERELLISRQLMRAKADLWKEIVREVYPLGARTMEGAAREYGFDFIDMSELLRDFRGDEVFADNVHYTEAGSRIIAGQLLPVIMKIMTTEFSKGARG